MRNRLLTITFTIACLIAIVVLVRQANIRPSGTRHHFATPENGHHLAAGAHHSLYIDSVGQLWAWGDAKFKNRETAIPVKVADSVMTVSAGDTSATSFSVSYTHLDVYKRQIWSSSVAISRFKSLSSTRRIRLPARDETRSFFSGVAIIFISRLWQNT